MRCRKALLLHPFGCMQRPNRMRNSLVSLRHWPVSKAACSLAIYLGIKNSCYNQAIVPALRTISAQLTSLDVRQCRLGPSELDVLSTDVLAGTTQLKELQVVWNPHRLARAQHAAQIACAR